MKRGFRYIRYILRMVLIGVLSALIVVAAVGFAAWRYRARIAKALLATALPAVAPVQTVPLASVTTLEQAPTAKSTVTQTPTVVAPTVASAVAKVNKSVVSIQVAEQVPLYTIAADGSIGQSTSLQTVGGGSGFFVSRNGLVLTNKHVVDFDNAVFTVVTASGKQYPATVIAKDPNQDIALLKIAATTTPVTFGDSSKLQLGQSVVAIGYALGQFNNSISAGIISGLSRSITAGDEANGSTEQLSKLIQTDAAINPGNSGGPLLTLDGNVIGVNVATAEGSQSIGFALPIDIVKSFVAQYN